MFIDFINQTIYGDKGVYLSHFNLDRDFSHIFKYVFFIIYIDINEYHFNLFYYVDSIYVFFSLKSMKNIMDGK